MQFHGNEVIETTKAVWDAILESHVQDDMSVFSCYTDPDKRIETVWGLRDADYPLVAAETTFNVEHEAPHIRLNEVTRFMLVVTKMEENDE